MSHAPVFLRKRIQAIKQYCSNKGRKATHIAKDLYEKDVQSYWVEKSLQATFEEAEEEESIEETHNEVQGERMTQMARGMGPPRQLGLRAPPKKGKGKEVSESENADDNEDADDDDDDGNNDGSEGDTDRRSMKRGHRKPVKAAEADDDEPDMEDLTHLHS